ncbi:MAG: glycosyl transferase [Rhizobiales bacterium]|nr:glycosyl transferase [Hyphomicrobiales bacterium]
MNAILIQILATALALSQVTTKPEAVRTRFDPVQDQAEVVELLRGGCTHLRNAFDIEAINLDDLIATAMDDPEALTSDIKVFRGINFGDLYTAYRQFCRNEAVADSPIDVGKIIAFYNQTLSDLPDAARMKHLKLPGTSAVLDGNGQPFTEVYRPGHRRVWVSLSEIPEVVQKAFIAAEDKRFYEHKGIDERGLVRAFVANILSPGRPQGGSTITQQVAKNVLVGGDVTYERKIREVIAASRLERTLTKPAILELYLNSIYLGRGTWGVEMAARSYFGKNARDLTLAEGALLASLAKGPSYFNPDRHAERSRERYGYVLTRMKEDGYLGAEVLQQMLGTIPDRTSEARQRRDTGFHFVDHLRRESRSVAGIASLTDDSFIVRSTLHPPLQRATEAALQEGLAHYESRTGRAQFEGPETNLAQAIARITAEPESPARRPAWQQALENTRLPLYDVHWTPAIVLESPRQDRGRRGIQVGLADGRALPLTGATPAVRRVLKTYDVVYVRVTRSNGRSERAELRIRPQVQGAALVLENRTGRILAMAGAFSYPLSQLSRVTQTQRQPGSALKPLTYLAALHKGLQPNTLVEDGPITLPPIGGSNIVSREYEPGGDRHNWTPKNFDGTYSGTVTLRRGLERSRNLATARLLDGGIDSDPERSLAQVCSLAVEAKIYKECVPHYPFILGAQPVRLIDLAAFYAAIANEGAYAPPYAVESIEHHGRTVYDRGAKPPVWLASGDRVAFYQLKSMLQGVLQRGTATPIRRLARYVAGKTGTSDDGNDAWFVGFTNEVTVAVWVGYDNADGKRRTLGGSQTGAKVAIPIFTPIIEAAWAMHAPKTVLSPPSREAKRNLVAMPIEPESGNVLDFDSPRAFMEYFRRDPGGRPQDMQYRIVSRYGSDVYRERDYEEEPYGRSPSGPWYPRGEYRGRGVWIEEGPGAFYRGRPYMEAPPPRRRNFLEEFFGIGEPSYRAPRDAPYYQGIPQFR